MATRGTKLTYKGIELLTQCQTGKELHFSKVVLGDGTVVAAGSVVNKSFPDGGVLVAGSPAKIIKKIN